ncbi:hypothetical protein GobsT_53570 [Gemmata obscuriglobus]|nr:hypothetical protein GobsT_53570 [Gemmata obscuriglobus]VTS09876.1 unnamed protein product [Gemmata obscuriglobus UQM 2246]
MRKEAVAWHEYVNGQQRGVEWQFRLEDARAELNSLTRSTPN